jgi:hypothetical protein
MDPFDTAMFQRTDIPPESSFSAKTLDGILRSEHMREDAIGGV